GVDLAAVALDHRLAVWLLLERGLHHVDLALEPELGAGERQGRAPLTGTGLGGDAPYARLGVVVGLGDGRVGLVGADRADALVLVVDAGRPADQLLEADRKSTRLNSSHVKISYAVFCL